MKTCSYCDENVPLTNIEFSNNPGVFHKGIYHRYSGDLFECLSPLAQAKREFIQMDTITITMEEIDNAVLEIRTSLENADLLTVEKRIEELDSSYQLLQKTAKLTKQKHIVALEMHDMITGKIPKEELEKHRAIKKVDDKLDK